MDSRTITQKLSRAGLQKRPSQLAMIEAAHQALEAKKIICIEAPTGTGKTISYCLASYLARDAKKTIVISTATIALQEQLFHNDLPLLEKVLDTTLRYMLVKGRRRYVCHARLYRDQDQHALFDDDKNAIKALLEKKQWNGEKDTLTVSIEPDAWNDISTDSKGCSGRRCEFYEDCTFYNMRKKMRTADFIITNHSVLLSDLELGAGTLLPDMKKAIYIIDECHHLPHKAIDHFSQSSGVLSAIDWINQTANATTKAVKAKEISARMQDDIATCSKQLVNALKQLHDYLTLNQNEFRQDIWWMKTIDDHCRSLTMPIAQYAAQLAAYGKSITGHLESSIQTHESSDPEKARELATMLSHHQYLLSQAEAMASTFDLFSRERTSKETPVAKWFEPDSCHAAPIYIGDKLSTLFWERVQNGAILCSATIQALGCFKDYLRRTGLKHHSNVTHTSVSNFFDYQQSVLFVPEMAQEPVGLHQDAHLKEVIKLLPDLFLPHSGTLVLFTSRHAMHTTYQSLPGSYQDAILMQGHRGKTALIDLHKQRIRRGQRSILFGLASFGEGLDLPADFCQHVIIQKLPFAVPSTPIELTRKEWLQAHRLNPFMLSALPAASIRLTQYVGRLIRQETDTGIVTILDKRLYSKPYGKTLLEFLPPFQRVVKKDINALQDIELVADLFQTEE